MTFKVDLGGMEILDLEILGWAWQMRWLRLKKTNLIVDWSRYPSASKCICSVLHLDIQIHPNAFSLFSISITSIVGDGNITLFWSNKWLHGKSLPDLAPTFLCICEKKNC